MQDPRSIAGYYALDKATEWARAMNSGVTLEHITGLAERSVFGVSGTIT